MRRNHRIILTILIILFPALFIVQGLDLTDTGFHLARVSNFIKQQSGGIVWFSYFIGYIWDQVFGQLGLTGFKILSYILYELTVWTVYFGFRKIYSQKYLLFYIFLGMLITLSIKTFFFSYDNVSNLFLVLGSTLLLVGVLSKSRIKILLAGFIFALSAFSRLPDILSLGMIVLFPLYEFIKKYRLRDVWESRFSWLKSTGLFLSGFLLGVSMVLVLIHLFGQLDRVMGAIGQTLNVFADSGGEGGHSATGMMSRQLESGKKMFNNAMLFVLLSLLFAWFIQHKKKGNLVLYYSLAGFGIATVIFMRTDHDYFVNYVNIVTGAQIALALFFFLRILQVETRYRFALICGIAVMFVSFMGSDTGLLKSATGWFITIPLLILIFDELGDLQMRTEYKQSSRVWSISSSRMKAFLISVIILTSLLIRYVAIFGDEGSRHKMVHAVDVPGARGTLTTEGKAQGVQVIYENLQKYIGKDDYLIGHGGGPLFIYLTGAKVYMPGTWILWYNTANILPDLTEAYEKNGQLPVILMVDEEKFRTVFEDEKPEISKQRGEIHKFMEPYDFVQVVKEEDYEIWVPANRI